MPERQPLTRAQLDDLLARLLTDAYDRQNTAERLRQLLEEWKFSAYNRAEDTLPADKIQGIGPLVNALIAAQLLQSGGGSFPADEPNTATAVSNLPAGSVVAGRPVVDVLRQAWSQVYQNPAFTSFTLGGQASVTVPVGTAYSAGSKAATWSTSNSSNVGAGTIGIEDITAGVLLADDEANDGLATVATAAFTVGLGESRRYRISATNSKGATFEREIVISGAYEVFYGPAASVPATSAAVRALPNNRLSTAGNSFTLNTGAALKDFVLHLPPGKNLVSIIDLDALNKDITAEYLASSLMVNDVAGQPTPTAGTRYVKSQAVPYSSNHRHQITIS